MGRAREGPLRPRGGRVGDRQKHAGQTGECACPGRAAGRQRGVAQRHGRDRSRWPRGDQRRAPPRRAGRRCACRDRFDARPPEAAGCPGRRRPNRFRGARRGAEHPGGGRAREGAAAARGGGRPQQGGRERPGCRGVAGHRPTGRRGSESVRRHLQSGRPGRDASHRERGCGCHQTQLRRAGAAHGSSREVGSVSCRSGARAHAFFQAERAQADPGQEPCRRCAAGRPGQEGS